MLYYELVHNLVLELTRVGIENRNLKMRLESLSSRMDFDERRARALETVVQYRPGTGPVARAAADARAAAAGRSTVSATAAPGATACAPEPAPSRSSRRPPTSPEAQSRADRGE